MYNFYQEQYKQQLNQKIAWFSKTGKDKYNKPTFTLFVNTKCRKVNKSRLIKDRDGKEKVSTTSIMTISDIQKGDFIADAGATVNTEGREVLSLHDATDPDGNFIGKTVRL